MRMNWDTYRRAVLRDGLWKFAKEMVVLTADADYTAEFSYANRYPLPADFLRLVSFNDLKGNADGGIPPYQVMNGYIYTNMGYANLVYISDVLDATAFDPLFCESLAGYIAAKLCNTLTGSPGGAQALEAEYRKAKQRAKFAGATEDPSEQLDIDVWMQSRVGATSLNRDPDFAEGGPLFP